MITFPDIPGISILPVSAAETLSFDVRESPPIPPAAATGMETLWAQYRAENRNLFDGPVALIYADLPARPARVLVRSTYKAHLCLEIEHMYSLGVQGVVIGRDAAARPHILLGRRSSDVRMYPGLWENAPSGHVPPPPPRLSSVDQSHFVQTLIDEGTEELGLDLAAATPRFVALLQDDAARSLDIMLRFDLPEPIDPRSLPCPTQANRWEYAESAWLAIADLGLWMTANAHAMSPPTLALMRWITTETA
jgi:isopentenyldiphosphate isomerase